MVVYPNSDGNEEISIEYKSIFRKIFRIKPKNISYVILNKITCYKKTGKKIGVLERIKMNLALEKWDGCVDRSRSFNSLHYS